MKIIFANSGAKNKSETMLEVISIGGWEFYQATFPKLSQNWVICIEKSGPNNFTRVATILDNLYWSFSINNKMLMKYLRLEFFLAVI